SPDLGFSLVRLGRLLTRTGRYSEAKVPLDRAIELYQRIGGTGTVRLAEALTARTQLRAREGTRKGALEDIRRALALRRERGGDKAPSWGAAAEPERRGARELFVDQAKLLLELDPENPDATEDAFAASQESHTSRTGEALRHSAMRLAIADNVLATLLRD